MGGVDLLDYFISQYKPTIHVKKWCFSLFLNCINMICVAAWRLYVNRQCDTQKDQLDFIRSVAIELFRNAVHSETAGALKSGQRIANKNN